MNSNWKENSATRLFYPLTRELKQNLNICRQAKEEIKRIDIWYINRNILQ